MSSARQRLARNVRLLLAKEGWNQVDRSRRAGLSQGMISQLLAGEKGVRLSTLDKVAAALNVDVSDLFSPTPAVSGPSISGLQAAMRSALSGAGGSSPSGGALSADPAARTKIVIDPEELRAIGFAIGYAIVEATQNRQAQTASASAKARPQRPRRPRKPAGSRRVQDK